MSYQFDDTFYHWARAISLNRATEHLGQVTTELHHAVLDLLHDWDKAKCSQICTCIQEATRLLSVVALFVHACEGQSFADRESCRRLMQEIGALGQHFLEFQDDLSDTRPDPEKEN